MGKERGRSRPRGETSQHLRPELETVCDAYSTFLAASRPGADGLPDALLWSCTAWLRSDDPFVGLAGIAASAILAASRLGVRPSLDDPVHPDGSVPLAGLERRRRASGLGLVRPSAWAQC